MEMRGYRLGYRGDIEGLRAVAILLVVAAHAGMPWLSGGFVGVDVFFVLSGYLITGLLLQDIESKGHLQFAGFYARRFRRLLPALLAMLAGTGLVAAVVIAPAAQSDQALAAATASLWLSNLHFAFGQLDYFSPGAAQNLFLHTWSLGVEEQFYLVWPALVALVVRCTSHRENRHSRLKWTMGAIAAISLVACILLTRSMPQMAFYMMPMRAWQFATGALTWLYFNPSGEHSSSELAKDSAHETWRRFAGWLGLFVVIAAGVAFDPNHAYPGWRAMLPTAGAAAIIAAGTGAGRSGVSRVLAWQPLQSIGRVSYAWYLWHWPVLLLGDAIIGHAGVGARIGLVILSLLLALASYRWIESPIRHQARLVSRPGVTVLGALALMVMANVLCITWLNAADKRATQPSQQRFSQAHEDAPLIYAMGCDDWFYSDKVNVCAFGTKGAARTAVLMGDSIGAQWFPAVASVFDGPDWRVLVVTKSSCPMVDEPIFYPRIGRMYTECSTWRANALKQIAAMHPDVIILGSTQTASLEETQWVEGTTRLLQVISGSTGHVYIVRGSPNLPFDGPDCLAARDWPVWLRSWRRRCTAPASTAHDEDVSRWLQQASRRFSNASVLDMTDAICLHGQCDAERNGVIVFRDTQHLTATFVKSLSGAFAQHLLLGFPDLRIPATSTTSTTRKPAAPH
jgi:peptidoglycan/LPS O-acetylase OafA/YrhL